jgi:hypothetical protein
MPAYLPILVDPTTGAPDPTRKFEDYFDMKFEKYDCPDG